jgi:hypothetical protein
LFARPWPLPTYVLVGSLLIVINEHLLGVHLFDASDLATAAAAASLVAAAAWSEGCDRRQKAEGRRQKGSAVPNG